MFYLAVSVLLILSVVVGETLVEYEQMDTNAMSRIIALCANPRDVYMWYCSSRHPLLIQVNVATQLLLVQRWQKMFDRTW